MDFKQTGMLRHCHFAEPERTNRFYVLSPFPPLSLSRERERWKRESSGVQTRDDFKREPAPRSTNLYKTIVNEHNEGHWVNCAAF